MRHKQIIKMNCHRKTMRNYLRKLFCEVWPAKFSSVFLVIQYQDKNCLRYSTRIYFGKLNAISKSEGMETLI